jgi:hypothetical protein
VAGIVYATWDDLQKNGLDDSMVTTERALTRSIPDSLAPTACDQIAAAYLVLREG